ncbi:MAG: lysophospholipid acyltransferase family protein [Candidatus Omnitrophota bacterium]
MKFKYRRYYLYYLARVAAAIFSLLPVRMGLLLATLIGRAAFFVLVKYRAIAIENLERAFGAGKTKREVRRIARQVFENLCKNGIELVNLPKMSRSDIDRIVRVENIDVIDSALRENKGIVVLTGHIGNWDLLAVTIRVKGYQGVVIGKRIYFEKYDRFLNGLRKKHDVRIIYRDESPKKILRALKDNWIVGILGDQDVDSVDGVFVDFFGRRAYTPAGPVLLAKASGAALIPAFIIRRNGCHTLVIEKPIELADTGDKKADLVTNTQRWSDVVETYIRRYPEQWVWIHRRWKTQKKV